MVATAPNGDNEAQQQQQQKKYRLNVDTKS